MQREGTVVLDDLIDGEGCWSSETRFKSWDLERGDHGYRTVEAGTMYH